MSRDNTTRTRLAEAIRSARTGPSLSFIGRGLVDQAKEDELRRACESQVRVWLDSWIIPPMVDAMRANYPPTPMRLRKWLARQPVAAVEAVNERERYLCDRLGTKRAAAQRRAMLEAYFAAEDAAVAAERAERAKGARQ